MIVADVNLLASLLLGGPDATLAQAVFEEDPVWAAPVLWRSEFGSILASYIRQRGLPLADAWQAHELAEGLLGAHEYSLGGERVLHLVAASSCSAYDCEYVALAEELRVPLVTADGQVLRSFPRVAVSSTAATRSATVPAIRESPASGLRSGTTRAVVRDRSMPGKPRTVTTAEVRLHLTASRLKPSNLLEHLDVGRILETSGSLRRDQVLDT